MVVLCCVVVCIEDRFCTKVVVPIEIVIVKTRPDDLPLSPTIPHIVLPTRTVLYTIILQFCRYDYPSLQY